MSNLNGQTVRIIGGDLRDRIGTIIGVIDNRPTGRPMWTQTYIVRLEDGQITHLDPDRFGVIYRAAPMRSRAG